MFIAWLFSNLITDHDMSTFVYIMHCNDDNHFITFCMSRRRHEMYCGHPRLCVCLSVCLSAAACLHYCKDPDVTQGSGRGAP